MIRITDRAAHLLAELARLILLGALVGLVVLGWRDGVPRDPEGGLYSRTAEVPIQIGLAVLAAVGLLISLRWKHVAAVVVAVSGTGLAVLSAVQHTPRFALAIGVVFLAPAVLLWLAWQHEETPRSIAALACCTALLLGASWFGADRIHDRFFGPAHPESALESLPPSAVRWMWSGDIDADGFSVVVRLHDPADEVRLEVEPEGGGAVVRSSPSSVADPDEPVRLEIDGLEPASRYDYRVVVDGVPDTVRTGSADTAPDGAASFTFAVSACARTGSNGAVFESIAGVDPDFYVVTGDLHYRDITSDRVAAFASAYDAVLTAPAQAALYRQVPVVYVWDDHDYGPNDADASSPSRAAALASYRSHVPHAELAVDRDGPIHHAFTYGRVRFVVTDTRSARDPDEAAPTMLGPDQLAWLEHELLAARDTHALTVWVNPTPWIAPAEPGRDDWGGFADERRRIADHIADHDITNLVMVSGDAHMVAIDDGTNTGFDADDSASFPLLQAAALDRPGSVKGGPYSHGAFPGAGQFGLVTVVDDGATIEVTLSGRTWEGTVLTTLERSFAVPTSISGRG